MMAVFADGSQALTRPIAQAVILAFYVGATAFAVVSALLSAAVLVGARGRLTAVTVGFGPTLYRHVGRRGVFQVRLLPLTFSYRGWFRPQSSPGWRRLHDFVGLCGGVVVIPVAFLVCPGYVGVAVSCGVGVGVVAGLFTAEGRKKVRLVRELRRVNDGTRKAIATTLLAREATLEVLAGNVAAGEGLLASIGGESWSLPFTYQVRLALPMVQCRWQEALAAVEEMRAALSAVGTGPRIVPLLQGVDAYAAQILLRAGEADVLPAMVYLPAAQRILDGLPKQRDAAAYSSIEALLAALAGDFESALPSAEQAVRHAENRFSLADELCTLALARAGLGDAHAATEALARARKLSPGYPRLDATSRRVDRLLGMPVGVEGYSVVDN